MPDFRFGAEITAALHKVVDLGEIDLRVEGLATPVYKPHQNAFGADEKRTVSFENVEFVEIPGIDGNIAAIAWALHHNYEGAVPTAALIKGLRLRTGNVQVGDYTLLEELFPEPRFNAWSVGEVHVIDRRIIPNGRRDHFEQNAHFHNLLNHLVLWLETLRAGAGPVRIVESGSENSICIGRRYNRSSGLSPREVWRLPTVRPWPYPSNQHFYRWIKLPVRSCSSKTGLRKCAGT